METETTGGLKLYPRQKTECVVWKNSRRIFSGTSTDAAKYRGEYQMTFRDQAAFEKYMGKR